MRWWGPLSNIWQFASECFCGLVVSRCKSRVSAAANVHEMLKLWVALQAVTCTNNSGISFQNKSQSSDHRHTSLLHPDWELCFLPPRWSYHPRGELEINALHAYLAKYLDIQVEDIDMDDENLLSSIKRWERILLEGVTMGSTVSTFSKCDVARENYFIRIRHENQSSNRHYTYSNVYGKIHHYLEI